MQTPDTEDRPSQPILASHNQHANTPERPSKRPRLTLACNECRKRKVKCDAEIPKCRNCRVRGIVCETTDPKHPELVVVRKYGVQYQEDNGYDRDTSSQGQAEHMSPSRRTSVSVLDHEREDQGPQNTGPQTSWIARSYRAQQALDSASLTQNGASHHIHDFSGQQVQPDSNESPEMAINSDGTAHKQKLMGGSSLQSLTMFLDLYLQRAGKRRIGSCFRHGMSFAEDYVASLVLEIPDLPPPSLMDTYFEAFVRGIHPLYPVLDLDQFSADIKRIRSYQDASWTPSGGFAGLRPFLKAHDIPILACIYAVISLGADEAAGTGTEAGRSFLSAAHGLYAHLVGQPHLSSVQALTLIMLALRGRGTEGQGFQVLGTAIRIAHSIGLHRHMELAARKPGQQSPRSSQKQAELHVRIWWTIYALEKLMELDTTRPSGIPHGQHDQFLPNKILSVESQSELKYFIHWISLARILEQICELLYRRKRGPESTLQILQCIGTIDSALRTWKTNLPEDIQPDAEIYCKPSERPFALFLALQYHHTLITLHRASLILPHNQFLEDVQSHAASLPHHARLRNGEALCTASARTIISLFAQMTNRLQTPHHTLTQLLHGCIVLALGIMRNPQFRTVRSDLELVVLGTELTEAEYTRLGQDPDFIEACAILRTGLSSFVQQLSKRPRDSIQDQRTLVPDAQASSHTGQLAAVDVDPSWNSFMPSTVGSENDMNFDFTSIFEGTGLEDLWMVGADVDMYSPLVVYQ